MPNLVDLALNNNPLSTNFQDVELVNGDVPGVTGTAAILQNILQTLRVFAGEWFLNTQQGVPYLQQVLIKNPSQQIIDSIFIAQILSVPGVTSLISYSFKPNFKTRELAISFKVQTTLGIVNYSGTFPSGTVPAGAQ